MVLVQACGSSRNRLELLLLLLRSDRDKQHKWTRYVPSPSVRRDFLRSPETCSCALSSPTWRLHCSCGLYVSLLSKTPLSRDSGLILRKYFCLLQSFL